MGGEKTAIRKKKIYPSFALFCVTEIIMSRLLGGISSLSFRSSCPSRRGPSNRARHFHRSVSCRLNRFLFSPEEVLRRTEDTTSVIEVKLPKDDYRTIHAAKVLGLKNGDFIRAGVVGSSEGNMIGLWTDEAIIEWIPIPPIKQANVLKNGNPPGFLSIRLNHLQSIDDDSRSSPASDQINVSLILALPRPLQLGRILPMISQLGVNHLILTSAKKVPKEYFGSHLFRKPELLEEKLIEGLCQAGDVRLPRLHIVRNLRDFLLSEEFDNLFPKESCARVISHPKRQNDLNEPLRMNQVEFPTTLPPRMVVAVGPEGGWEEPHELDLMKNDCGFQQITLGSRSLRSDVAVCGILSLAHEACHSNEQKK